MARTVLVVLNKGPGTHAGKDATNELRGIRKPPFGNSSWGGEGRGERKNRGVRFSWSRCSLVLSFWSLLAFQVSLPVNAWGLAMGGGVADVQGGRECFLFFSFGEPGPT